MKLLSSSLSSYSLLFLCVDLCAQRDIHACVHTCLVIIFLIVNCIGITEFLAICVTHVCRMKLVLSLQEHLLSFVICFSCLCQCFAYCYLGSVALFLVDIPVMYRASCIYHRCFLALLSSLSSLPTSLSSQVFLLLIMWTLVIVILVCIS
jgi:hypothetical protein